MIDLEELKRLGPHMSGVHLRETILPSLTTELEAARRELAIAKAEALLNLGMYYGTVCGGILMRADDSDDDDLARSGLKYARAERLCRHYARKFKRAAEANEGNDAAFEGEDK